MFYYKFFCLAIYLLYYLFIPNNIVYIEYISCHTDRTIQKQSENLTH